MFLIFIFVTILAQSSVITVGNKNANYQSIQAAIDKAWPGDIIEVNGGIYKENVTINQALVLQGINDPVIDSMGQGSPISLTCGGSLIEGFNLKNSSEGGAGINIVLDSFYILDKDNLNTSGITIRNNTISGNHGGIAIEELSSNTIEENIIKNNKNIAVTLIHSGNNMLSGNIIVNNREGISLEDSSRNVIEGNSIINNSGNGIALRNYYLTEYGPYGFSDNNSIRKNKVENNGMGIFLRYAELNHISYNRLLNNRYGIYLDGSSNNIILNNTYVNNSINYTSRHNSRHDVINESRNQTQYLVNFFDALSRAFLFMALLVLLFTIGMGLIMGIAAGLIIEKVLKSRRLSLVGNAVTGMIGFNIGFYAGLLLTYDLSIAFIIAVLTSLMSIFFIKKAKST